MPTTFGSFDAFMATITAAAGCLRTESDVRRLITEIVEDAADQGVRWIEPSMWPGLLGGRLGSDEDGLDVVLDAGLAASASTGVGFGLVVAWYSCSCPMSALSTLRGSLGLEGCRWCLTQASSVLRTRWSRPWIYSVPGGSCTEYGLLMILRWSHGWRLMG